MQKKEIHIKLILLILSMFLLLSCDSKNEEVFNGIFSKNGSLATILTTPATSVTDTSAEAGGNLTDNGSTYIIARGICWGTDQNPDTSDFTIETGKEPGEFVCSITGLSKGTLYYMRAYVSNNIGTAYGNQETFTTLNIPAITTSPISDISDTTAVSGGNITADGGVNVTARGVCWSTKQNPTITDTISKDGSGKGIFTSTLKRLVPNATYYVKAWATNSIGTAYGNELAFTTTSPAPVLPSITTTTISAITQSSAVSGGNITSDGGATVTARGVCWSTSSNPTIENSRTYDGTGSGAFTSTLSGLTSGTLYYVRAYATNSIGTAYGNEFSFTSPTTGPTAFTNAATNVAISTATFNGSVNANGVNTTVTFEYGIALSYGNSVAAIGSPLSGSVPVNVTANISGLTGSTLYHFRVKAVNLAGTAFGKDSTFTTLAVATIPSLTTAAVSSVTQTTAVSGGNITSNGGATVTSSGICWGTSPSPTIALTSKTTDGLATGAFAGSLTGLTANTTYYVRSYATNSVGTAYGNEISFTTLPPGISTITDIDGNVYNTVTIGTQTWMKENLKTTRYSDGIAISNVTDNNAWSLLTSGAYCWWVNDQVTYKATYGALYNYYAIDNKNLCPIGWHVPTNAEWTTLTTYLGGESVAGSKLKETGNTHWMSYNTDATNESGFTAIPGGYRVTDGNFMNLGAIGYWWSSTDFSGSSSWGRLILHINTMVSSNYFNKVSGFSVRCLQGETVVLPGIMTTNPTVYNTSVSTGGNLLTTGGGVITDMGVCWSTSPNVTISSGSKSSAGTTALGFFTIPIPSLTPLTTYYIKAYATNSAGTGYGVEFSFTTGDGLPSVSTTSISGISNTSASSGGTITTLGNVSANTRGVCWSTTTNPTIANSKTTDGSGAGIFTSSITGLSANTTYYVRAYATNIVGTAYGNEISFTTLSQSSGTVTDIDGNVYNTVIIGTQIWMKENLKTTKYRDGSSVQNVTDNTAWSLLTSGAYCWLLNDQATYKASYGAIYNYYAFENRNLCPTGWHVPTESEWTTLTSYLGGENIAGGKLKEAGTDHWQTPNTGATNETAFTALPGGYRAPDLGLFYSLGSYGYWASSTEKSLSLMWGYYLNYNNSFLFSLNLDKRGGYSVRCLQGEPAPLAVGDNYKGGKIAYIFQPGDNGYVVGQVHGLIAAPGDQSTGAEWGCNGTNLTGADSTGLGKGNQNTIDIVTGCATAGTAAKICSDLVLSGYSDWYLPSRDELNKLYLNQSAIGGFSTSVYWSSSEYNEFAASTVAFGPGGISNVFKYETHYVRAVRSF